MPDFSEKMLKHGAARTCADGFVALFQLGFELRELLDICGKFASDMPSVDRVGRLARTRLR